MTKVASVVMDKTGTVTKSVFKIKEVVVSATFRLSGADGLNDSSVDGFAFAKAQLMN